MNNKIFEGFFSAQQKQDPIISHKSSELMRMKQIGAELAELLRNTFEIIRTSEDGRTCWLVNLHGIKQNIIDKLYTITDEFEKNLREILNTYACGELSVIDQEKLGASQRTVIFQKSYMFDVKDDPYSGYCFDICYLKQYGTSTARVQTYVGLVTIAWQSDENWPDYVKEKILEEYK